MDFYRDATRFLDSMISELKGAGLLTAIDVIDHICLRVTSLTEYEAWKTQLATFAVILTEAYINGRPIAVYKLNVSLKSGDFCVDVVELPAPKPDRHYAVGFEHIEAVCKIALADLLAQRSDLIFSLENFNAPINRDLQLKLNTGLIKFHDQSLEALIVEEAAENEKKRTTRLAIFDFDDTLVQSKELFLDASRAALSAFLSRDISADEVRQKARQTFPEYFANFAITSMQDTENVLNLFRLKWDEISKHILRPEGIHTLLSCLHSEGIELVIWTARDRETTATCLKRLGIEHFFAHIFAFDVAAASKPDPSPMLTQLAQNRTVFMVGDSRTDLKAAQNIGATFYQAAWFQQQSFVVDPNALCASPMSCLDRLMSLFNRDR